MRGRAGDKGRQALVDMWRMLYFAPTHPADCGHPEHVSDLDRLWALLILLPQIAYGKVSNVSNRQTADVTSRLRSFFAGDWE